MSDNNALYDVCERAKNPEHASVDDVVELVVTFAIRELVLSRLDVDDGASPVGERVWYRQRGG